MKFFKATLIPFSLVITSLILWAFDDPYAFKMTEKPPGYIHVTAVAGSPRKFEFTKWKINKFQWQTDDVESIDIEVLIDCKSLTNDWKDLEKNIKKKKDYFFVKKFPTAVAAVSNITKNDDLTYRAQMKLSLKGVTHEVPVTFKVISTTPYQITGTGRLNRREFNFDGNGPEDIVDLNFEITLPENNI